MPTMIEKIAMPVGVSSIAAVVYNDEKFPLTFFSQLIADCRAAGVPIAGVMEGAGQSRSSSRYGAYIEDLSNGHRMPLFERRGEGARGCRLNYAALTHMTEQVERCLETRPAVLIINKFGKAEAEGCGLRSAIIAAVARGIPVIIGLPLKNADVWRSFAGGLAREIPADMTEVRRWLRAVYPMARSASVQPELRGN